MCVALKALQVQEERDSLRLDCNELEERVNPNSFSPRPVCCVHSPTLLITPACVCTCVHVEHSVATPQLLNGVCVMLPTATADSNSVEKVDTLEYCSIVFCDTVSTLNCIDFELIFYTDITSLCSDYADLSAGVLFMFIFPKVRFLKKSRCIITY